MSTFPKTEITIKQLYKQFVADTFSKEIQTGYTTTYVWMANQLGHFSFGFCLTYLGIWITFAIQGNDEIKPHLWIVPILHLILWILKEIKDVKRDEKEFGNNNFKFEKAGTKKDAFTAVSYIVYGICVSFSAVYYSPLTGILVFIAGTIPALLGAKYWLTRKYCFQQVGLPYQYRLSSFPKDIFVPERSKDNIYNFIDMKEGWRHMVIFGQRKTHKTSLAVGIGTEHSFKVGKARYMPYFKFIQSATENLTEEIDKVDGHNLWGWSTVNILIIDDVEPSMKNLSIITPEEFEQAFNLIPDNNKEKIQSSRTVWVLGEPISEANRSDWVNTLQKTLKTESNHLGVIKLERKQA